MSDKRLEKRTLKYVFTASEIHYLSLQLAGKNKEKMAIEEEKSSISAQYGAKVKEVTATINKLSNQVTDGYELREVDGEIEYHKPAQGKKTFTRKDNGEKIIEKMEDWEWNLFNQPEEEEEIDDDLETVEEGAGATDSPKKTR